MTRLNLGRIAGAAALAIVLSAAAPAAFAFDTGGSSGSSSGSTSGGNGGNTTAPAKPAKLKTPTAPTLTIARADIKAGNWTKAIADLKLIVKSSPKNADGWNLLGFSYRNHGDLKLADAAYDKALKLNPSHTGALSYQGLLYIKMGEKNEAEANLARIAKICGNTTCPEYVQLQKALG